MKYFDKEDVISYTKECCENCSTFPKNLYENAFSSFRQILIMTGIRGSVIGFTGILYNLADRSALGINMFVAMIPAFYAIIICTVLMVVEARIGELVEE